MLDFLSQQARCVLKEGNLVFFPVWVYKQFFFYFCIFYNFFFIFYLYFYISWAFEIDAVCCFALIEV